MPKLDSRTNAAKFKFMAATEYWLRVRMAVRFILDLTTFKGVA